jgi:hypothetical protein
MQPISCFLDDVRLNLARMRQKRRDALKGSAGSKIKQVQAPVRHGRRAAIMPTESTLMSRPSISTAGESDSHSDTADDNKTRPTGILPGLNEDEMSTFMTKLGNEADDGSDHSASEDNGDTYSGQSSGLLPGLNPGEMASLMSKIGNDTDKESIAESETDENETQASGLLPGLNLKQMQSFMSKHAPEGEATSNNDSDADDNNVAPEMGLLPGLNPEQMASLMKTVGTSSIDDADSVQE